MSMVIIDSGLSELQVEALAELMLISGAGIAATAIGAVVAMELETKGLVIPGPDARFAVTPVGAERLRAAVQIPAYIGHCGHCCHHFKAADLPGELEDVARQMREAVRTGCPACGAADEIYLSQAPVATAWWVVHGRRIQ